MKQLIIIGTFAAILGCIGCGNTEQSVKSPFSHLDTVKSKVVKQEEKKEDGGVKSPFSGLDKK
jgi:hypothetical protein